MSKAYLDELYNETLRLLRIKYPEVLGHLDAHIAQLEFRLESAEAALERCLETFGEKARGIGEVSVIEFAEEHFTKFGKEP